MPAFCAQNARIGIEIDAVPSGDWLFADIEGERCKGESPIRGIKSIDGRVQVATIRSEFFPATVQDRHGVLMLVGLRFLLPSPAMSHPLDALLADMHSDETRFELLGFVSQGARNELQVDVVFGDGDRCRMRFRQRTM